MINRQYWRNPWTDRIINCVTVALLYAQDKRFLLHILLASIEAQRIWNRCVRTGGAIRMHRRTATLNREASEAADRLRAITRFTLRKGGPLCKIGRSFPWSARLLLLLNLSKPGRPECSHSTPPKTAPKWTFAKAGFSAVSTLFRLATASYLND